ncbi:MAG: hypothetical protein Q8R40_03910 [bacterium]|nr:hypothetical protein [bacterium]
MSLFFSKAKRHHIVIDVGSNLLKAAIFDAPTSGTSPLNVKKITVKLGQSHQGRRVVDALHELLFSLLKEKGSVPEKVVIGIGINMADVVMQDCAIDVANIRESLTPTHIKRSFHKLFDEHCESQHAFFGYPISLQANGYPIDISALSGQDPSFIKEITLRTMLLYLPDDIAPRLMELKKMFGGMTIIFLAQQASYAEILIETQKIKDAILIDVGAAITTLIFIRNGVLMHLTSFLIGADRFTHRIIKKNSRKFLEAKDLTRQYTQGIVSKDEQTALSHVFSQEAEEWKKAFMQSLEAFYPIGPLPQDFYLFGGGSYMPEVRSALWSPDLTKSFSYHDSLSIHIVQASSIFNGDSLEGVLRGPEDVGLATLMYYSLYHTSFF